MSGEAAGPPPPPGGAPPRRRSLAAILLVAFALALAAWGVLTLFPTVRDVVFLSFVGGLLAAVLEIPVRYLSRWIPRSVATFVTLLGVVGLLAGLVWLALPMLVEQGQNLAQQLPEALAVASDWLRSAFARGPLAEQTLGVDFSDTVRRAVSAQVARLASGVVSFAFATFAAVTGALLLLVLALFLAHDPRLYIDGLLRLVPKASEPVVAGYLERLGRTVRSWMLGTLASMTVIGAVTGAGLLVIGIDNWLILGVLAFFGEFIPYAGPILTAVPAVLIALAQSPALALWVAIFYFAVQHLEGALLVPVVMRHAVRIPPALLLVWQLALASAFGFVALLAATPLLACIQVTIQYFYVERILGKPAAT